MLSYLPHIEWFFASLITYFSAYKLTNFYFKNNNLIKKNRLCFKISSYKTEEINSSSKKSYRKNRRPPFRYDKE